MLADALAHGRDVHRELFSEYGDERDMVRERLADRSRPAALRALAEGLSPHDPGLCVESPGRTDWAPTARQRRGLEVAARGGHTTAVQNSVTLVNVSWSLASLIQQAGTSHRRWC